MTLTYGVTDTDADAPTELDRTRAKIDNLRTALDSSRTVAIALGITMERLHLSRDDAFALLRSVSQTRHRKMRDLASQIVFSGEIPTRAAPVQR